MVEISKNSPPKLFPNLSFSSKQMQFKKIILPLIFSVLLGNSFAFAANSDWIKAYEDSAKVRLISSSSEKDGVKKLLIGAHFKISDGWKIYGADSGNFGLPPQFNFENSKNYKSHNILWPKAKTAKETISDEVIQYSYYKNEVIIPIEIEAINPKKPVDLVIKLNYGVCKDICIPANAEFNIKIDNSTDEEALKQIEKFHPDSYVEEEIVKDDSEKMSHLRMVLYAVIFGVIGGAILNIMPCVLPVLSIKLISVIKHSQAPISKIRFAFLSTIFGILASFLFFAFFAIALKSSGESLGWGLQFQNPYFLLFLIAVLTLFSANLLGLFEISSQQVFANFLNQRISRDEEKNIFIPNFSSGILAVLLATPCSAPFLGSAISFALVSDSATIITISLAIGIGFALPYIILIFSPKLISHFPKPGEWMIKLKKLMALLLMATIIWLLYVLSHNIGILASLLTAVLCALVLFSFRIKSHFFRALGIGLLIIAIFSIPQDFKAKSKVEVTKYDAIWKPFSEDRLEEYVKEGKIVLVDITADWCLTCKFNKVRVLHDSEIMKLLKSEEIIGLRADITKPDEKILKFMKENNRFAIPFNAVYGPSAKTGLLTSELLSKTDLLELIKKAE